MEWQPIETAPDGDRVLVCGWQGFHGEVYGHWWWQEDVCEAGKAIVRPDATHWCPMVLPEYWPDGEDA